MLFVLAEATSGSFVSDYVSILGEPAHWAFEFTVNLLEVVILAPIAGYFWNKGRAKWMQRGVVEHDAVFHPEHVNDFEDTLS
jgi:hypothetical protein